MGDASAGTGPADEVPAVKRWLIAVRPWSFTAAVTPVLLGLALSVNDGYPVRWWLYAVTVVGMVLAQAGANLLNDCFDHRRGLDTQVIATSGAVVRGWISERQALIAGLGSLVLCACCGLFLVWQTGLVLLWIGLIGVGLALIYTGSGFCLKYIGLGDLTIFLAFGPLPVAGTYWVQAEKLDVFPILWSVPLALLTVGILHANNWRDIETDPTHGCRTAASFLGPGGAAAYYRVLMLAPFPLLLVCLGMRFCPESSHIPPWTVLLTFVALPKAIALARVRPEEDRERFLVLDGLTAQLQMIFGLLLPVSLFTGLVFN